MMEAQGVGSMLAVSGAQWRRRLVQSHRPRTPLPQRLDAQAASREADATAHGAAAFCSGDDSLQACCQTRA
jgi:hypothetical protein